MIESESKADFEAGQSRNSLLKLIRAHRERGGLESQSIRMLVTFVDAKTKCASSGLLIGASGMIWLGVDELAALDRRD